MPVEQFFAPDFIRGQNSIKEAISADSPAHRNRRGVVLEQFRVNRPFPVEDFADFLFDRHRDFRLAAETGERDSRFFQLERVVIPALGFDRRLDVVGDARNRKFALKPDLVLVQRGEVHQAHLILKVACVSDARSKIGRRLGQLNQGDQHSTDRIGEIHCSR